MNRIPIKTEEDIRAIRLSAKLLAGTFKAVEPLLRAGTTTQELNDCARRFILDGGGESAFLGYQGYPADICVSINEQVVHGIPGKRKIREGDLVSLDVGVNLNGYFSDAARTYTIGSIPANQERLVETTREAVLRGIRQCLPGKRISDISHAIQVCVESQGFNVVRSLVGHGIGKALHEEPQIPNYGPPHRGAAIKTGMVFAIEAMVNMGSHEVMTLEDGWTVRTADGLPSAHYEQTILITDGRPDILTQDSNQREGWDTNG
jgi:methionyl aminopeptidase